MKNQAQQVAATIMNQLGGNKFKVMTGCKNFIYAGITESNPHNWLRMDIPRNAGSVNRLKVTLMPDDTYEMHFYKQTINRKTYDVKITHEKKFSGVFFDQLQSIFTEVTGMYTRL